MNARRSITAIIGGTIHYDDGSTRPLPSGGDGDDERPDAEQQQQPDNGGQAEQQGDEQGDGDAAPEPPADPSASVPGLPENMADADEQALRDLYGELGNYVDEQRPSAQTADDLAALQVATERQTAIVAELERRRATAQELAEGLQQFDQSERPALPDPVPALASAAAVVQSRGAQPPAAQQPPAPEATPRPRVAALAATGNGGSAPGDELDLEGLGRAIDAVKRGRPGQVVLASIAPFVEMDDAGLPEALGDSARLSDRLIREAVEDHRARQRGETPARTAAICDPLDIIRDIPSAFTAEERVPPVFPQRPMGRLGFQHTPSMSLSDVSGGVAIWDEDDQDAVDPTDDSTWKPCVDVECSSPEEVRAEAIVGCLRFDITTEMSSPERIANANAALQAVRQRNKEGRILQRLDALSSQFRFDGDYGALPALIEAINTVVAQMVYANRLDESNYTVLLPPAVPQILTIDRANRAYGAENETEDVLAYLRANLDGVTQVVRTLDASLGGEPGLPFPAFPAVGGPPSNLPYISGGDYRVRIFDPTAFIYSETGEMNAGVTRSPDLLRQNKAQFFVEEFIAFAKHGPQHAATIDVVLCADGSRAGLIEPEHCASS